MRNDELYEFSWDHVEKRVLGTVLKINRPLYLLIVQLLWSTFFHRQHLNVIITQNSSSYAFLSLENRSDHSEQQQLIINEIDPRIIISTKKQSDRNNVSLKISFMTRLTLLCKSISSLSSFEYKTIPEMISIVIYSVKFLIDDEYCGKIVEQFKQQHIDKICSLSFEHCRGFFPKFKKHRIKTVAFQHGILNHNGGYSEESMCDRYVLWHDRYALNEVRISCKVKPTNFIIAPTTRDNNAGLTKNISGNERITTKNVIVYISSPMFFDGIDYDELFMREINKSCEELELFNDGSINFCLHPSKSVTDYSINFKRPVYIGASKLMENNIRYIGLHSTFLVKKLLEGEKVALLTSDYYSRVDLHAHSIILKTPLKSLPSKILFNELTHCQKKTLKNFFFGEYVDGQLKRKLDEHLR